MTLMDAPEYKPLMSRRSAIRLGAAALASVSAGGAYEWNSYREREMQGSILSYLSNPKFISSDFVQQVTGTDVEIAAYDVDDETVYFKMSKEAFVQGAVEKLTKHPSRAKISEPSNDARKFGSYKKPETFKILCHVPIRRFHCRTGQNG